jgi:hypothetical protein
MSQQTYKDGDRIWTIGAMTCEGSTVRALVGRRTIKAGGQKVEMVEKYAKDATFGVWVAAGPHGSWGSHGPSARLDRIAKILGYTGA